MPAMPPTELISYIKEQLAQGLSREGMQKVLLDAGWSKEQITEAWRQILSGVTEGSPVTILQGELAEVRTELRRIRERLERLEGGREALGADISPTIPSVVPRVPAAAPVAQPRKMAEEPETQVTGKLFAAIGIIALLFGVSFLLKYAFDHNLIGYGARVLMGVIAGGIMLICGDLLAQRAKYKQYSFFISGGGLALIYLSLFFGFASYHLFGRPVALAAMVLTTVVAFFLSLKSDEQPLTAMAVIGGYLTPLLVYDGLADYGAVSAYGVILLTTAIAIAHAKGWVAPAALAVGGNAMIQIVWLAQHYDALAFGSVSLWLTLAFLISGTGWVWCAFRRGVAACAPGFAVVGAASAALYLGAMSLLMQEDYRASWGAFLFFWAFVHAALVYVAYRVRVADRETVGIWAALAALIAAVAVPAQFDGVLVTALWLVEALVASWVLRSVGVRAVLLARLFAGLSVVTLLAHDLSAYGPHYDVVFAPFANGRIVLFAFAFIVLLAIARMWRALPKEYGVWSQAGFLGIVANILFVLVVGSDLTYALRGAGTLGELSLSLLWLVWSGLLMLVGVTAHLPTARKLSIAGFSLVVLKVFLFDVRTLSDINRIIAFLALAIVCLLVSFFWYRYKDQIKQFLT